MSNGLVGLLFKESRKPLKKEGNENLRGINFKKFTATQVDQALENSGYSDNRIKKARFNKMSTNKSRAEFIYDIEYDTDDEEDSGVGKVLIFVDSNGSIAAEWHSRTFY